MLKQLRTQILLLADMQIAHVLMFYKVESLVATGAAVNKVTRAIHISAQDAKVLEATFVNLLIVSDT